MPNRIKRIQVENFRLFSEFSVSCREHNLLVGPNNSGKSTILDALRALSDVMRHVRRRGPVARDQAGHGVCATYELPLSTLSIPIANVATNYSDRDAVVTFTHENGTLLILKLHPDRMGQAFVVVNGRMPATSQAFLKAFPVRLVVVPTLAPLEEQEPYVLDETVRRNETTRLASRNFRNIWLRANQPSFDAFRDLVEESWPGIALRKPEIARIPRPIVQMFFEEKRMLREVYWSGFGFQAWIQMINHLMRGDADSVLVLDEPDVYLHPDLQRRLYQLVEKRLGQSFVATHSTEIVNEAHPGNILLVRRGSRSAQRVTSDEGYRQAYAYLGPSENADFARIARAKRIIFFEGKDRRLVRRLAEKAGLRNGPLDDADTVFLQAGGYEQWRRVKEVGWTLHHVFRLNVKVAAIFDKDYRPQEEMEAFAEGMCSEHLLCLVLSRKEIENYVLSVPVLVRALRRRLESRGKKIGERELVRLLEEIADQLREETRSHLVNYHIAYLHRLDPATETDEARETVEAQFDLMWAKGLAERLNVVSGKSFVSMMSAVLQSKHGTSISSYQIVDEMRQDEVPPEIVEMLKQIENFIA